MSSILCSGCVRSLSSIHDAWGLRSWAGDDLGGLSGACSLGRVDNAYWLRAWTRGSVFRSGCAGGFRCVDDAWCLHTGTEDDIAGLSGSCSLSRVDNACSLRSRARCGIACDGSALSSLCMQSTGYSMSVCLNSDTRSGWSQSCKLHIGYLAFESWSWCIR